MSKGCNEPIFSGEADGATEGQSIRLHEDGLDPLREFDSRKCRPKVMHQIVVVIALQQYNNKGCMSRLKLDCFAWAPKKHFFCGLYERLIFC